MNYNQYPSTGWKKYEPFDILRIINLSHWNYIQTGSKSNNATTKHFQDLMSGMLMPWNTVNCFEINNRIDY